MRTSWIVSIVGLVALPACGAGEIRGGGGGGSGNGEGGQGGVAPDGGNGNGPGGSGGGGGADAGPGTGGGGAGGGKGGSGPAWDGCTYVEKGVGQVSRVPRPKGKVARETPFTLTWHSKPYPDDHGFVDLASGKHGGYLVDLNGDGKLDFVSSMRLATLGYLPGDGKGGFGEIVDFAGKTDGGSLDFGDIDGNGKLDIIGVNHGSNQAHVWLGYPFPHGTGIASDAAGSNLHGVALGDFNRDGHLDAVLGADQFGKYAGIALGDGKGRMKVAATSGLGSPNGFANIVAGDFDNDGDIDVFGYADSSEGGTPRGPALFLNDGTGLGWKQTAMLPDPAPAAGATPHLVSIGDLNCDGNLDVAAVGAVWLGDGKGGLSLGKGGLGKTTLFGGAHMQIADMDGDGHLDVVARSQDLILVQIFYGDGSGKSFTEGRLDGWSSGDDGESVDGMPGAMWHAVGDVDGNGNLDVFVIGWNGDAGQRAVFQMWTR